VPGAERSGQQVISQRDRTDKGVVFLWTGKPGRQGWTGAAQERADTDLLHADMLARGLRSRLVYHTGRERRLADGFATAPSRTGGSGCGHRPGSCLGVRHSRRSESKQLLAAWGVESAREYLATSAEAAVEPGAARVSGGSQDRFTGYLHKTEAGVVRLNLREAAQVRTAYAEVLASAKAYAPRARIIGVSVQEMVGDGVEGHHWRVLRPAIGPGTPVR